MPQMVQDLNDLGMGLAEFIPQSRNFFTLLSDLADVFEEYYLGHYNRVRK